MIVCAACNGPTGSHGVVTRDGTYCLDCFHLAQTVAKALGRTWPATIRWLASEPPRNPAVGHMWIDLQTRHLMIYVGGQRWLDCVSGARFRVAETVDGTERPTDWVTGERFAGPEIKHEILDEVAGFADPRFGTEEPEPEPLHMWVIYKNPSDFAGRTRGDIYVLRQWHVGASTTTVDRKATAYGSLEKIRSKVPPGLVCMVASPGDDPTILETWF